MFFSVRPVRLRCWLYISFIAVALSTAHAQSVLIPSTTRRDLVFDYSGQNLYISNSNGVVQTFNLSTLSFGTSYNLGGSLNALDIARDNSFLLVAQNTTSGSEGTFHKVDLITGIVTNINYTRTSGEDGAWDLAIGSNGLALVTTQSANLNEIPIRQINLTTNVISIRSDVPGSGFGGEVEEKTHMHRSADGARFFFVEGNLSTGPVFTYSATSNTFGRNAQIGDYTFNASVAVSRNGSLIAFQNGTNPASLNTAPDFNYFHSFNGIDGGVAFDPSSDILYAINSTTDQIIAYSTQTFAELFRLTIGENMSPGATPFGTGVLAASADGRWLALETPSGIRLFLLSETSPVPAQALNISTRLRVETGDGVMIGGFIVTGSASKDVAVRGIGPSLVGAGIIDVLADPILELRDSTGALLFQNDNWQDDPTQAAQLMALGLALQNPNESGIFATLQPNAAYTAIVEGGSSTGVGLVEIYDTNQAANSRLANISTRGAVQTGDSVMIGGFILGGGGGSASVAVRGIGPSLSQSGVSNVLTDPALELRDSNGALLIANDNWQDDSISAAQLIAHGLAPQNALESGIFTSLAPGAFTAILAGKNSGIGIGLVEIYNVQ